MEIRKTGLLPNLIIIMMTSIFCGNVCAQEKNQMVRLAKLVIDSAQLESYKGMLKEEIETSVKMEPGVRTLYAVFEKDNPTHITILEIYADTIAYKSHIETAHFKKYKEVAKNMVTSLELVDVNLIGSFKKPGL